MFSASFFSSPPSHPLFSSNSHLFSTDFTTTTTTTTIANSILLTSHLQQHQHNLTHLNSSSIPPYPSSNAVTFYVRLQALFILTPILLALPLGHLSERLGEQRVFTFGYIIVALGLLLLLFSSSFSSNLLLFIVGYAMYATNAAVRVVRFSLVARFVETRSRTLVMALYQLMIPVGAFIAPAFPLLFQYIAARDRDENVSWFVLNFSFCIAVALILAMVCLLGIPQGKYIAPVVVNNNSSSSSSSIASEDDDIENEKEMKEDEDEEMNMKIEQQQQQPDEEQGLAGIQYHTTDYTHSSSSSNSDGDGDDDIRQIRDNDHRHSRHRQRNETGVVTGHMTGNLSGMRSHDSQYNEDEEEVLVYTHYKYNHNTGQAHNNHLTHRNDYDGQVYVNVQDNENDCGVERERKEYDDDEHTNETDTTFTRLMSDCTSSDTSSSDPSLTMTSPAIIITARDVSHYRFTRMAYITLLMLLMNLTYYLIQTSFQPFLLRQFHITDSSLSHLYILLGLLSLLPPILVTITTHYIHSDRVLILLGAIAKLLGAILYLPLFATRSPYCAMAAYVLALKGTTFFTAAAMSLLTKLLGPLCSPMSIAKVTACANVAAVGIQLSVPERVAVLAGTWQAVWIIIPAGVAIAVIVIGWSVMNEDGEWTRLILDYVNELTKKTESMRKSEEDHEKNDME